MSEETTNVAAVPVTEAPAEVSEVVIIPEAEPTPDVVTPAEEAPITPETDATTAA